MWVYVPVWRLQESCVSVWMTARSWAHRRMSHSAWHVHQVPVVEEFYFRACLLPLLVPALGTREAMWKVPYFFGLGESPFWPAWLFVECIYWQGETCRWKKGPVLSILDKDTHDVISVKLPWILPIPPMIFNGAPGSIQGNLTGMTCMQSLKE